MVFMEKVDVVSWQRFWMGITGQEYDFSRVVIPRKPELELRLIIMADITLEKLCSEDIFTYRWTTEELDEIVGWNERTTLNGPYAFWVSDSPEFNNKLKGYSANDIKKSSITTETLAECMVHEIKYFQEAGKFLDTGNMISCAGSRYSDSGIPYLAFREGGLMLSRLLPNDAGMGLYARQVFV